MANSILDRDLALTEISLQAASLAESVRGAVAENARRIVAQYPGSGLTEAEVVAEFHRLIGAGGRRFGGVFGSPSEADERLPLGPLD